MADSKQSTATITFDTLASSKTVEEMQAYIPNLSLDVSKSTMERIREFLLDYTNAFFEIKSIFDSKTRSWNPAEIETHLRTELQMYVVNTAKTAYKTYNGSNHVSFPITDYVKYNVCVPIDSTPSLTLNVIYRWMRNINRNDSVVTKFWQNYLDVGKGFSRCMYRDLVSIPKEDITPFTDKSKYVSFVMSACDPTFVELMEEEIIKHNEKHIFQPRDIIPVLTTQEPWYEEWDVTDDLPDNAIMCAQEIMPSFIGKKGKDIGWLNRQMKTRVEFIPVVDNPIVPMVFTCDDEAPTEAQILELKAHIQWAEDKYLKGLEKEKQL